MNKFFSIIELSAKRSLWKVLAVLAVFAAGELAWFAWRLSADAEMNLFLAGKVFASAFGAALLLVTLIVGGVRPSKALSQQRIRLLGTSQQAFYLSEAIFGLLCMLMVWAVQAAVIMAAAKIYTSQPGYAYGPQGPLVQISTYCGLLAAVPLTNASIWAGNILNILSLAICTAQMRMRNRRNTFPLGSYFIMIIVGFYYLRIALRDTGIDGSFPVHATIAFVFSAINAVNACVGFEKERRETDDGE